MKLLLSCYECSPIRGSECGVGWNWAIEARRLGHEVWVLVSPTYEDEVLQACASDPLAASIHWLFPQSPLWRLAPGYRPKAERRHNLLWQFAALAAARRLAREVTFDLVHHVTWGGFRVPSFLWKLPVPFIFGPVGGGESSPRRLRDAFSRRSRTIEALRDLSNATLAWNPPIRNMLRAARVIAAKTPETLNVLPRAFRHKAIVHLEIGTTTEQIRSASERPPAAPRLLFAGRLLYWKGAHLAIAVFAQVRQQFPDALFTVVGRGPEESALRAMVERLGLAENVRFVSWIEQAELFELYAQHDVFLFPSLHDSSGNVVLEALCRGLPVVCLDLGGPKEMVSERCGVVVPSAGHDSAAAAAALGQAVIELLSDPSRLRALSRGATERARQLLWRDQVGSFYGRVQAIVSAGTLRQAADAPPDASKAFP